MKLPDLMDGKTETGISIPHSMKTESRQRKSNPRTDRLLGLRTRIANHPFFRDLNAAHLDALTGCARQTRFLRDVIIFNQGGVANRFYLIEDGCVVLKACQSEQATIRIQTLGAGDALGWSWLFPPHIWRFSARTVEPTHAISFDGTRLRAQFKQNPALGNELMKRMAIVVVERLQATQIQLVEISQIAMQAQLQALQLAMPTGMASPSRKV